MNLYQSDTELIASLNSVHVTISSFLGGSWHEGKGGELRIEAPSQNILLRSSVEIVNEDVLIRFCVGLPAKGRSICGKWAAGICCDTVNDIVTRLTITSSEQSSIIHVAHGSYHTNCQVMLWYRPRLRQSDHVGGSVRRSGAPKVILGEPWSAVLRT